VKSEAEILAYWPQRRLQDAIYGSVWACMVLRRHTGVAADDAARAAGVEPGSPSAPIVWEITGEHVAIKMVEWARVHHMRGRLLEDPVKEVAAMQLLGARHPNVLGSNEVLQDGDFLYSVMPYCRDGDLFGVVVEYAEQSGGAAGMLEPVARYWFRQILQVRRESVVFFFKRQVWLFIVFPRYIFTGVRLSPTRRYLPQRLVAGKCSCRWR
jgi:serine/threonine protein kinase